jgi:DNA-binding MarR family transcriptional regulator
MANDRSGQGNDAASPVRPVRFAGSETSEASTTNIGLSVESFVNLLRSANHGLLNIVREVWQKYPFPPSGMVIIAQIMKKPGATISQVARETGFAKSHVSKTIDILCNHGFVEKGQDPSDQRVVRLFATEELVQRFKEVKRVMENRLSEVLAVIPRASLDCLVRGLEMLNKALEETGYTETT